MTTQDVMRGLQSKMLTIRGTEVAQMAELNLENSRSKSSVFYLEAEGAKRELVDSLGVVAEKSENFNRKQAAFEASVIETGFWRAVLRDNGVSKCSDISIDSKVLKDHISSAAPRTPLKFPTKVNWDLGSTSNEVYQDAEMEGEDEEASDVFVSSNHSLNISSVVTEYG